MKINLEEEIIDGYKVSSLMKKVWAKELDLLERFDAVCKQHGLRYWAAYGTLMGAVRHGGFIPWDDDIDLFMMRSDFNRLIEIGPSEFSDPCFFQSVYTDNYGMNFAKIRNSNTTGIEIPDADESFNQGLFIDIFPLDSTKDGSRHMDHISSIKKDLWTCMMGKTAIIKHINDPGIWSYFTIDENLAKELLGMNLREGMRIFDDFCQAHEYDSEKINCWTFEIINNPAIYDREWYSKTSYVDFYGISLPIPEKYDEILSQNYGDWRTPIKRNNQHTGIMLNPDVPYVEVLRKIRQQKTEH